MSAGSELGTELRRHAHQAFVLRNVGWIAALLDASYGSPDHGNKEDPVDEMVYIQLSRRTHETGYKGAFEQLKKMGSWEEVLRRGPEAILAAIRSAGLGPKRALEIHASLAQIEARFGKVNIEKTRRWSNDRLLDFLISLPGIGPKSAYCIMMYSLKRRVFPADAHVITVLDRIGIIPSGLGHKRAQQLLSDMFPEGLRYSLHVNLVAHGRAICRKVRPKCEACNLRNFCLYFRRKERRRFKRRAAGTFADVFCGGGGASRGFVEAGFQPTLLLDSYQPATDTTYLNLPMVDSRSILTEDIRKLGEDELERFRRPTALVAGLPCQGWSKIGRNSLGLRSRSHDKDPRNLLYRNLLRSLRILRPQYVVIENVPPLAHVAMGKYAKRIRDGLQRAGYVSSGLFLDAFDFGVPQHRLRYFILAVRTHGSSGNSARLVLESWRDGIEERKVKIGSTPTARTVFGDLPAPLFEPDKGKIGIIRIDGSQSPVKLLLNHIARPHNPRDRELFGILRPGENARDAISKYKRPDLMTYSVDNFVTKYRRLREDSPLPTIIAHLEKDSNSFIHPWLPRGITPREAARGQGFPDDAVFLGGAMRAFRLVGNAIPPPLAAAIASALKEARNPKR